MLGALIGDIVGSRFEWNNIKTKDFTFFHQNCFFTDDTVMSLAVCDALLRADKSIDLGKKAIESMQTIGRTYPHCSYGGRFSLWLRSDEPTPYNSWGNGSAMRVSGCGFAAKTLLEAKELSRQVTEVTHNHPEGLKGAEATAVAVFLAREGESLSAIRTHIEKNYYSLGFTLDDIREAYRFDESCQGTVPQALEAFFEARSFEDAIRNAISIGGDSDTLGAITGAIAEAFFGIPDELRSQALTYLDGRLRGILEAFESRYPGKRASTDL